MNKMSFDTSTKEGLNRFQKFFKVLINLNKEDVEYYNDIHIYQEENLVIIEWEKVPYSHEWGGRFQFINEDQVVMLEKVFPDNHSEYCYDEEDYKERLDDFLKENPGWVKTSYGTWTNQIQNSYFWLDNNEKYLDEYPYDSSFLLNYDSKGYTNQFKLLLEDGLNNLKETNYIIIGKGLLYLTLCLLEEQGLDLENREIRENLNCKLGNYKIGELSIPIYYRPNLKKDIYFMKYIDIVLAKIKCETEEEKEENGR